MVAPQESCPVCRARVAPDLYPGHLASHSKDEIVAALVGGQGPGSGAAVPMPPRAAAVFPSAGPFLAAAAAAPAAQRLRPPAPTQGPTAPLSLPILQAAAGGSGPSQPSQPQQQPPAVVPPLFMPQMMGMMQVMSSPCLIPQPNGPPLLVNMPSYVYPNMAAANLLNPGMGSLLAAAAASSSSNVQASGIASPGAAILSGSQAPGLPSAPVTSAASNMRAAPTLVLPTATPRGAPSLSSPRRTNVPPTARQTGPPVVSLSDDEMTSQEPTGGPQAKDLSTRKQEKSSPRRPTVPATAASAIAPPSPVPGPSRSRKASGPMKLKIKNRNREAPTSSGSDTAQRTSTVQDTLLSETSADRDHQNPLLSASSETAEPSASTSASCADAKPCGSNSGAADGSRDGASSSSGAFGFTQYAEDSPYPAASLNFPSMLLEPQAGTSSSSPGAKQQSSSTSSFVKEAKASSSSPKKESSGSKVCTVQTVGDLQDALKSEEDVQIVVPNELLETTEFKSFLSGLNSFPLHEAPVSSPVQPASASPTASDPGEGTSSGSVVVRVPPNTPNTTRPPSAAAAEAPADEKVEEFEPKSPQPCSSRDVSTHQSPVKNPSSILPDEVESDDDITLQDLVALETMEDADVCEDDEDDQFFTLSTSTNPLEPFMNSILQAPDNGGFSCDRCGLHFASILEFREHNREVCQPQPPQATKKGKKSTSKRHKAKNSSARALPQTALAPPPPPPAAADDNAKMEVDEDEEGEDQSMRPIKLEPEVKSELLDSNSQPVLGGLGGQDGKEPGHWKCNQCRAVFENGPQLLEHLDQVRNAEHNCPACHLIFDDRKLLLLHRRKFHPATGAAASATATKIKSEPPPTALEDVMPNENGEFVCDKCDRAFKDRDLLGKHMACHDEERPFECLECGKKFSKASLLRDHRRRHFEVGQFECGYCHKRFYTPNKLREHVRIHTGEAPLSCNICGKTFKRHSNLSEHKRIHQENRPVKPPKELFCHCGKVFKTQRDLDWHKEGEHDRQPKKCTYCGEVFVHGSSLTRHIRLKHESNFLPTDKKKSLYAKCPICAQTFYKTSINKHIRIKHQGQKPYNCDVCSASFVTKCNLLNHQWQHRNARSRPFKCQLCSKAYLRQALLDAHMRSHRGVKPFVCNECGLQFANKSNWQRHVAEHSGARNYECPHCHKRFSRGYYLTDHLKVHTGEKPYACNICGKLAATRSNYNSHMRTHITREPVNSEV